MPVKKSVIEILPGTIRLGKDTKVYEKTKNSWRKTNLELPNSIKVIELFKAHNNFNFLIDIKQYMITILNVNIKMGLERHILC